MTLFRTIGLSLLITLMLLAGCSGDELPVSTKQALQDADHFELLTLLPDRDIPEGVEFPDDVGRFHGEIVLGRVVVDDQAIRDQLSEALHDAARGASSPARCFQPRHGIRIKMGDRVHDLVICFECLQARVYESGSENYSLLLIGNEQAAIFNSIAEDLGLALTYTEPDESP